MTDAADVAQDDAQARGGDPRRTESKAITTPQFNPRAVIYDDREANRERAGEVQQ